MGNSQNPTARKEGLVIQEMPDEVLVYDLNTNKAHCLNQTAAFVWKSCNGQNTVADIKRLLEKDSGSPVSEDFIWLAIDQLNKDNLLQEKINTKFEGVSRREVIKKIGLASVVALPVVASLAVPTSALANVSCNIGANCAGNPSVCNTVAPPATCICCPVGTPNQNTCQASC